MKRVFHIKVGVFAIFFFIMNLAQAQSVFTLEEGAYGKSSAFSRVSATIVKTYGANEESRLEFGKIYPNHTKSSVNISPTGERNTNGFVSFKDNQFASAKYSVAGEDELFCQVELPVKSISITNSNNSKSMIVSDWTSNLASSGGVAFVNNPSQEVNLGATLMVGSEEDNPAGVYSGTYNVTFLYN